jgi:hypothetical protein
MIASKWQEKMFQGSSFLDTATVSVRKHPKKEQTDGIGA